MRLFQRVNGSKEGGERCATLGRSKEGVWRLFGAGS